ncbi:wax ester/triacylglycerol synthase family O-acyltransferase [Pseudoduganella namucuonensis]|uniref:diacylglycerol O-acyltransferase n=1 Tax=Pseudoduganella namucuonensis TaxID=1035707 RepID=A0A1I7LMB1_9BURK|nr:wax ester/triacylglycerol synthase family O-acyltransferase [Pseudoduganella namucuonensis]SFV10821.1 Diacylglycerol O-acyltransferase [Pseudoduganella namucuonensis]
MLSKALSALSRKKMSTVDTAWLRMDSEGNQMMIVGVAMMGQPIAPDGLREALETRFLAYRRFRSKVVTDLAGSWWEELEVDLDRHVVHTALAAGDGRCNKPALQRLVGELSQRPLDPEQPLWQMHLVDNCVGEDGKVRQALIVRIHHCIADGVALVGVFMSMFGQHPDAHPRQPPKAAVEAAEANPWEQILNPITATSVKAIDLSSAMFLKSMSMWTELDKVGERLAAVGHTAAQLTADAVKLTTMADDSRTLLKGKPNGKKHVSWSEPLPLDEVKTISKAYGCSVNDVLMSCVAGALRGYLVAAGDAIGDECEVRVMVPVNLRKAGGQQKLGNAFGLVPLVLPVGMEDPVARLLEVRRRMNDLKGSYTALVAMSVLGVLGASPRQVQNEIQNFFARKATAVMSNVPGPRTPLYLAGSQLDQVMFWVPQSGDIGVGVSILSYNGGVQFGIVTDDALVRDPDNVIGRFGPEFEKLVLLALMGAC